MMQILFIGVSAGAAAALLFASRYSGSLLALLLVNLAPLPILIAGIGWGNAAGFVAGALATLCVGLISTGNLTLVFAVSVALPAFWLAHLALLARPGSSPDKLEWYPPGRILFWAAVITAAATAVIAIATFGADAQSFHANIKGDLDALESAFRSENNLGTQKLFDTESMAKFMPPVLAGINTVLLLINASLAMRIVNLSGQLRRPWPELVDVTFPRFTPGIFAIALAGTFLPDLLGILSKIFAGAFTAAFAVLGLVVLHVVTRGMSGRLPLLIVLYVFLTISVWSLWPAILLALLGIVDATINLRGRSAAMRGPPSLQ